MRMKDSIAAYFKVDKELLIVFLLVAISGFIFFFIVNQRAFLNLLLEHFFLEKDMRRFLLPFLSF